MQHAEVRVRARCAERVRELLVRGDVAGVKRLVAETAMRGGMGSHVAVHPDERGPGRDGQRPRLEFVVVNNNFMTGGGGRHHADLSRLGAGAPGERGERGSGRYVRKTHKSSCPRKAVENPTATRDAVCVARACGASKRAPWVKRGRNTNR